jgi:AcrR family transcriptional regulator
MPPALSRWLRVLRDKSLRPSSLRGGEKGLSMRALAKAAHTNTPAVYRRYKSRKQILGALVQQTQQDLSAALEPCVSLQDAYRRLLEFLLEHPHEYQLINAGVFSKVNTPRPNFELIKKRSAEWLGGSPEEHTDLILALWALAHGTASLLISRAVPSLHETDLRSVADRAAALLVQNASILSARK